MDMADMSGHLQHHSNSLDPPALHHSAHSLDVHHPAGDTTNHSAMAHIDPAAYQAVVPYGYPAVVNGAPVAVPTAHAAVNAPGPDPQQAVGPPNMPLASPAPPPPQAAAAAAAVPLPPGVEQGRASEEHHPEGSGSHSEKNALNRAAIAAQVDLIVRPQLEPMDTDSLSNWLNDLKAQSAQCTREFETARNWLKQVETARTQARESYRNDQRSSARQAAWKEQVALGKQAQEALRSCKEASYRASAAVEIVDLEYKRRTGASTSSHASRGNGGGGSAKRRRTHTPPEACPYCNHTYTVRDGLSTKAGPDGANRLHLRKCQCRKKTPPCKNCPSCRDNPELMSLSDPIVQQQYCESHIKCPICACNCPGSGKWIEGDTHSRQYYWARTNRRKDTLSRLGWHMTAPVNAPQHPFNPMDHPMRDQPPHPQSAIPPNPGQSMALDGSGAGDVDQTTVLGEGCHTHGGLSERQVRQIKRLPADIRAQVHALQGVTGHLPQPIKSGGSPGAYASASGYSSIGREIPCTPAPELPAEVDGLVKEVFEVAAGQGAVLAVGQFLRSQRVTQLVDLQFLQLPWLQDALGPLGLPPLLLNKFLTLAHQRCGVPEPSPSQSAGLSPQSAGLSPQSAGIVA